MESANNKLGSKIFITLDSLTKEIVQVTESF